MNEKVFLSGCELEQLVSHTREKRNVKNHGISSTEADASQSNKKNLLFAQLDFLGSLRTKARSNGCSTVMERTSYNPEVVGLNPISVGLFSSFSQGCGINQVPCAGATLPISLKMLKC